MSDTSERTADSNISERTSNPIAMESTNRNDLTRKEDKEGKSLTYRITYVPGI